MSLLLDFVISNFRLVRYHPNITSLLYLCEIAQVNGKSIVCFILFIYDDISMIKYYNVA